MPIDPELLLTQCARTLERTDFDELGTRIEGKVRDAYMREGRRILVTTDRISCFDVIVGTIPFKGQVLNELAAFWFQRTADVAPHHLVEVPDPNVSICLDCRPRAVEFVYRAYLTGVTKTSIWSAYERGDRDYCGHRLPDGMHKHQRLEQPLLTPTTKAERGDHDEVASREQLIDRGLISADLFDRAAEMTRPLFEEGMRWAEGRGLILVDTKYELGLDPDGDLRVIDEVHTPDSSRYWYRDGYERALSEGVDPKALDKEYVRRWLASRGYRGDGPPPEIPDEVRCEAASRYIEAYERITGVAFKPSTDDPLTRIRRNLGLPPSESV
jgi:phosphoribosylaminoimidazole-succinocarboxamide synthase